VLHLHQVYTGDFHPQAVGHVRHTGWPLAPAFGGCGLDGAWRSAEVCHQEIDGEVWPRCNFKPLVFSQFRTAVDRRAQRQLPARLLYERNADAASGDARSETGGQRPHAETSGWPALRKIQAGRGKLTEVTTRAGHLPAAAARPRCVCGAVAARWVRLAGALFLKVHQCLHTDPAPPAANESACCRGSSEGRERWHYGEPLRAGSPIAILRPL
jgi:hypothetical protein